MLLLKDRIEFLSTRDLLLLLPLLVLAGCSGSKGGNDSLARFDAAFTAHSDSHLQSDSPAGYYNTPSEGLVGSANALRLTVRMPALKVDPKWTAVCQVGFTPADHVPTKEEREKLPNFYVRLANPANQPQGPLSIVVDAWTDKKEIERQTIKSDIKVGEPVEMGIYWGKPDNLAVALRGEPYFNLPLQFKVSDMAIISSTAVCDFDSIKLGNLALP